MAAGEDTSHILSGLTNQLPDRDPEETAEWIESLDTLIREQGTERAQYIMRSLLQRAGAQSVGVPMVTTTDYVNTIPVDQEAEFPGNEEFERRYRAYMRWNAAVMVHRSQRPNIGVGGHISTYAGAATLYEVGFNHFFRGKDHPGGGDQVFFQGHASPGMYARAFMEGRLTEEDLDGFRQEKSKAGPRPVLLPAPAADAGVLGIPHRVDGHRADERDLPGPVQPVPAQPRPERHLRPAGLGVPGRRRNGRARVPRPAPARREREPGQPELRDQLQPPAPGRAGARQRQDHAGTRGVLPRRGLERHQGRLGPGMG